MPDAAIRKAAARRSKALIGFEGVLSDMTHAPCPLDCG
jgi:hypothetical protein